MKNAGKMCDYLYYNCRRNNPQSWSEADKDIVHLLKLKKNNLWEAKKNLQQTSADSVVYDKVCKGVRKNKVRTEYSKQTGIPINPVCIGFPIGIFPYILFPDPRQSFPALFTDMGLMACMEFSRRWGKNLLTSISMPLPTAVKTK